MSRPSWLQRIYWTRLAQPKQERVLFRTLIERPISTLLEIGIGEGARTRRIAKLVRRVEGAEPLRYIGVDEFESSQGRPFLTLKQAHRMATGLGFKAWLIPGDAQAAMPRVAHKFGPSDLVIIDGGLDLNHPTTGPIGMWLNRLAHDRSVVLAAAEPGGELVVVNPAKLDLPLTKAA